jgi:hypothetical protein
MYWIKEKDAPPNSGRLSKPDLFAELRAQRGKITEIYDAFGVADSDLETLKKDERFREQCHFIAYNDYKASDNFLAEFDGDFIDALIYVNDNFYRLQGEFGVNRNSKLLPIGG